MMAETESVPDVETVRETRPARRPLTGEQLQDVLGQVKIALTDHMVVSKNVESLKEELKEAKHDLESVQDRIMKLSRKMVHGEERDVDVDVTYDYSLGWVTLFDAETGEVFEEREMTEKDRQGRLALEDSNKDEDTVSVDGHTFP